MTFLDNNIYLITFMVGARADVSTSGKKNNDTDRHANWISSNRCTKWSNSSSPLPGCKKDGISSFYMWVKWKRGLLFHKKLIYYQDQFPPSIYPKSRNNNNNKEE